MSSQPKTMDMGDWGLLILLSLLWGGAFFFAGVAVRELPPLTVVLVRVALAAAMLLPLFWWFGHRLPQGLREWWPFLMMGLLNNVLPFGFIFAGQTYVTVGLAAIINALTPLFTVLVMAGFREETLTGLRVTGVILGVVGVAVLKGFGESAPDQIIGILLCIAGAVSYGFAALWARRHLVGVPPLKGATCQLLSSTMIMSVIVAAHDQPWTLELPSRGTVWSLVALAALGTAAAYLVFFQIILRAGASNVMLVTLLIPVSAMILGNLYLDEPILIREVVGALIIGIGLLFIDGRMIRLLRKSGTS
ncbi:MAG: DMT family transporter [Pseudomonadota bacterium]